MPTVGNPTAVANLSDVLTYFDPRRAQGAIPWAFLLASTHTVGQTLSLTEGDYFSLTGFAVNLARTSFGPAGTGGSQTLCQAKTGSTGFEHAFGGVDRDNPRRSHQASAPTSSLGE